MSGAAIFFWLFAAMAVTGAVAMITRKNAISAVMCLVGTVVALAALYAMLFAHFLSIIQVLVYAGAIMVLFVFVIMILNKEEEEPWALRGWFGKLLGGAALGYFLYRLIAVLADVPERLPEAPWDPQAKALYGTTRAVGRELFTTYLFPFEAVSIVLLVAVVGAIVLGRSHAQRGVPGTGEPRGEKIHKAH